MITNRNFYSILIAVCLLVCVSSCTNTHQDNLLHEQPSAHFDVVIGKVINGEHLITYDKEILKEKWANTIMKSSSLIVTFSKINIEESSEGLRLTGEDEKHNLTSTLALVVDNNLIYEIKSNIYQGSKQGSTSFFGCTVSCSGCTSTGPSSAGEGDPHTGPAGSWCSSCSQGTCTKTVTCPKDGSIQ